MKRPIILTAAISILISVYSIFSNYTGVWILFFALLCLLIYYLICIRTYKYLFVFIVAILTVINILLVYATSINPIDNMRGERYNVTCTVLETEYKDNTLNCVVRITKCGNQKLVGKKVLLYANKISVKAGNTLEATVAVYDFYGDKKITNYSENIFAYGGIYTANIHENPNSIYTVLEKSRSYIEKTVFENMNYEDAATIIGILLGRRSFQTADFRQNVINSGVSHVMVVSGMHMAIICGSVLKFFCKSRLNKVIGAVLTAVFTLSFMALCGFTPSVLRAGIMYFVLLLSMLTFHRRDALSALCVAVVIIVLINPFIVGSISFCLSAASTAGIIIINPIFQKVLKTESIKIRVLSGIVNIITVTLSALIATLPITLVKFDGISLVGVLTNLLITTAVTLTLQGTFAALLLSVVPWLDCISLPLFEICGWLCKYINTVINYLGSRPFSYIGFN